MSNMMPALVKTRAEPGIWMEEVPEIGPNDVLIKVKKTAICGTDVHIYNWDQWAQKTVPVPMVTGHEFVGTVADFGAAVLVDAGWMALSRDRGTANQQIDQGYGVVCDGCLKM